MNTIFSKQNIQTAAFGVFFASLFWGMPISSIGIFGFLIYFVVMLFINGIQRPRKQYRLLLLPLAYFTIALISTVLLGSIRPIGFEVEVMLSLALAPILFGIQKEQDKIPLDKLLIGFLVASVASISILFMYHVLSQGSLTQIPRYSSFSFIHPSYLALYLGFGIFIAIEFWHKLKSHRLFLIYSIPIQLLGIYFTDSKAGILVLLALLAYESFKKVARYNRYLGIGSISAIVILLILLFSYNPRFITMKRVALDFKRYIEQPKKDVESTGERIQIWYSAIQLIKERPLIGYGNGKSNEALYNKYMDYGFTKSASLKLNAHNQYLESWVRLGVLGFALLLVILLSPLWLIDKPKRNLYMGFLILFALNFLFESMLQKQAGIVFFTFFWCAFVSLELSKRDKKYLGKINP